MDGARFANACASLRCSPAEMTWKSGVDVLCFGGTKNGMAVGEAVLFFDRKLAADFDYRCKQAGQLASKMRFLSAPWVGMLESGAWMRNAAHATAAHSTLPERLRAYRECAWPDPLRPTRYSLSAGSAAQSNSRARVEVLHIHRRSSTDHVFVGHRPCARGCILQ